MKKVTFYFLFSLLTACSASNNSTKSVEQPYMISDQAVLQYIEEVNNIEYCLPKGTRINTLSDLERRVLTDARGDVLRNIIGQNNLSKVLKNEVSYKYFEERENALKTRKITASKEECKELSRKFLEEVHNRKYGRSSSPKVGIIVY
ncbi:DUF5358 family protein [Haemophilus parainfluenzae]|jgi:lipoprotein|uniref:DUF5358 family protein n=1 Tax=Haemophilus parainfluenzae TaxID=729 RepID=UPI000FFF4BD0|nr:DUF5358 family protein [Haemophilus parainfluenzae]KAB1991470.1 hypothetical protein F8M38_08150 [Haemophilus parainfluenzae]QAT94986.1 hypothetical protein ERO09_02885 [Haemophilus parainfluenzae]